MNLTQIASADLKRIVTLMEQKETLLARIAKIDAELAGFNLVSPPKLLHLPRASRDANPGVPRKPRQAEGGP